MGPQIAIYDKSNTVLASNWNIGTVKAQQVSDVYTVHVWNNKGGKTLVSDLRNTYVSVLDANGETAVDDVASEKWIQINVPAIDGDDETFTPIGGSVTKQIQGNSGVDQGVLSGGVNDGNLANSPKNVATLNFIVLAPPNSAPGMKSFVIRINGTFS